MTEYNPLSDPVYMSPQMVSYFTEKLKRLHVQLLQSEHAVSLSILNNPSKEPDHVDQGIIEEYRFNEFAFQDQEDYLRKEVQEALNRIEDGTYGFCQETGEPIGVKRLELVPYARYSIEVQSQKEQEQKLLKGA